MHIAGPEAEMQNHLDEILDRIRQHEASFAAISEFGNLGEPRDLFPRTEARQPEQDGGLGAGMARMLQ